MGDRADEIAREIADQQWLDTIEKAYLTKAIAAALRSYRNEGLEEAAKQVFDLGDTDKHPALVNEDIKWLAGAEFVARAGANLLRSLKV